MRQPPDRAYHISHKGRKFGPFTRAELSGRRLTDDMLVWSEGMAQWLPVGQVPELQPYVQTAAAGRTSRPPVSAGRTPPRTSYPDAESGPLPATPVVAAAAGVPPFTAPSKPALTGQVKFLGIVAVVLGSLGLLVCPLGIVGSFWQEPPPAASGVTMLTLVLLSLSFNVGMLVFSVLMLISGLGLLYGRRWGATFGAVTSGFCLVGWLAVQGSSLLFLQLPLLRLAGESNLENEYIGVLIGIIIGTLVTFFAVAWHATNLMMLSSSKVRSQLT
jgi:hypothetical protein